MLMALDLPLPKQVLGHPWLLFGDGAKMSKSRGNIMYADDLVAFFGVDEIRYYILSEMNYANDGIISYKQIIEKVNSDLANVIGNLVNRTITMEHKYFNGQVKRFTDVDAVYTSDRELADCIIEAPKKVDAAMKEYRISDAIAEIIVVAKRCNKYIDEMAPWSLFKDEKDHERLARVMYNLLEGIRVIGVLLAPFIPGTSKKILEQLNTKATGLDTLGTFGNLEDGIILCQPEILFNRIDTEKKLAEIEEINKKKEGPKTEGIMEIGIEDFARVQLKTGRIISAEAIKGAKKLLKLQVEIGQETRQIVSGIAQYYTPEDLVGKTVVVIVNLKPVMLRGVLSSGMLLAASNEGKLSLVTIDSDLPSGSGIS
jgi:methionyl-tRNA synthetase